MEMEMEMRTGGIAVMAASSLGVIVALCAGCRETPRHAVLYEASSAGVTVNGKSPAPGLAIGVSDEVVVDGAGSFARLKLDDGTKVFLHADAASRRTVFSLARLGEQAGARSILLRLVRGVAALVVPRRPAGSVLEVQASYTTTAIRGTQVRVSSGEAGDEIAVREGQVEVRSLAGATAEPARPLAAGEKLRFDAAKGFQAKETYDGLSSGEEVLFRDSAGARPIVHGEQ
jgi:ferric-dicitrate binding protein FerR (iron transport regulator)